MTKPLFFKRLKINSLTLGVILALTLNMASPLFVRAADPVDKAGQSMAAQARNMYNQGVELFKTAQIQAGKGDTQAQARLLKTCLKDFQAAANLDPKLVEAQSNIGFVYLTMGNYKKAIEAFKDTLDKNPHHLNSLNGLATTYAFDDQIDQSKKTFQTLVTLAPGNPDYLFNMGAVLQKAGQIDEAKTAYEKGLRLDPDHQRILFNMGTLFENKGAVDAALQYYEKAKGVEIGNTIGLEAIHRIEALRQEQMQGPDAPVNSGANLDREALAKAKAHEKEKQKKKKESP